jgi:nickel/cobalt exporter
MTEDILILTLTAASLGLIHTSLGPDHYLPFIAMAKARKWSQKKTILITTICGLGHVFSSVVIGLIGIGLGIAVKELEMVESTRGEIAGWMLIGFGFLYLVWGLKKAWKNKPHKHLHTHKDGTVHIHEHTHNGDHTHVHNDDKKNITPWVLFTIFIFGPCEVLIPLFIYTASIKDIFGLVLVTSVFGIATVLTMVTIVFVSLSGIKLISFKKIEKYTHALAGGVILICGVAINFFGL